MIERLSKSLLGIAFSLIYILSPINSEAKGVRSFKNAPTYQEKQKPILDSSPDELAEYNKV